jgi:hypothetical protein
MLQSIELPPRTARDRSFRLAADAEASHLRASGRLTGGAAVESRFCGVWLLMHVIDAVSEELPGFWEHVDEEAYSIWLAFAIVPAAEQEAPGIVTGDELRWPS